MVNAIAQYNFRGTQNRIVPGNLLKSFFGKFYRGCFAFNQDFGVGFFGNQQVDSLGHTVQNHFSFADQGRGRITFARQKIMNPVLPHPFFRRKQQIGFAGQIINKKVIFVFPEVKIESFGEI